MPKQQNQKKKGCRKAGRNKRQRDGATSAFVRGKIEFDQYAKDKGIKRKV